MAVAVKRRISHCNTHTRVHAHTCWSLACHSLVFHLHHLAIDSKPGRCTHRQMRLQLVACLEPNVLAKSSLGHIILVGFYLRLIRSQCWCGVRSVHTFSYFFSKFSFFGYSAASRHAAIAHTQPFENSETSLCSSLEPRVKQSTITIFGWLFFIEIYSSNFNKNPWKATTKSIINNLQQTISTETVANILISCLLLCVRYRRFLALLCVVSTSSLCGRRPKVCFALHWNRWQQVTSQCSKPSHYSSASVEE